jgi:hypothetical protein
MWRGTLCCVLPAANRGEGLLAALSKSKSVSMARLLVSNSCSDGTDVENPKTGAIRGAGAVLPATYDLLAPFIGVLPALLTECEDLEEDLRLCRPEESEEESSCKELSGEVDSRVSSLGVSETAGTLCWALTEAGDW